MRGSRKLCFILCCCCCVWTGGHFEDVLLKVRHPSRRPSTVAQQNSLPLCLLPDQLEAGAEIATWLSTNPKSSSQLALP